MLVDFFIKIKIMNKKLLLKSSMMAIIKEKNDLSLHCTDFFLERRNSFDYLHFLEEVDLQIEVKMKLEVVSLQANHLQLHRDLNLEATTSRQWR